MCAKAKSACDVTVTAGLLMLERPLETPTVIIIGNLKRALGNPKLLT